MPSSRQLELGDFNFDSNFIQTLARPPSCTLLRLEPDHGGRVPCVLPCIAATCTTLSWLRCQTTCLSEFRLVSQDHRTRMLMPGELPSSLIHPEETKLIRQYKKKRVHRTPNPSWPAKMKLGQASTDSVPKRAPSARTIVRRKIPVANCGWL